MLFSRWLIGFLYSEVPWGWKSPTQWTGNWKYPKRNNLFFGLFTIWMTVWKAAQKNTEVLLGIWSEGLFVLLSLVVNATSRSNVYSTSWMDETLEGSRKAWYYITIMTPANSMDARIQSYSLHVLGPGRFILLFRHSPTNILETDFQAGTPWWSLTTSSWHSRAFAECANCPWVSTLTWLNFESDMNRQNTWDKAWRIKPHFIKN